MHIVNLVVLTGMYISSWYSRTDGADVSYTLSLRQLPFYHRSPFTLYISRTGDIYEIFN